jgi:hypothetical protein
MNELRKILQMPGPGLGLCRRSPRDGRNPRQPLECNVMLRLDVIDAVNDAFMIRRLVNDYGASKRDIARTFGHSRLGKSKPVVVARSPWSVL